MPSPVERRGMMTVNGTKLEMTSMPSFVICCAASVPQIMRAGWLFGIIR